jgi:hypothetical protein
MLAEITYFRYCLNMQITVPLQRQIKTKASKAKVLTK